MSRKKELKSSLHNSLEDLWANAEKAISENSEELSKRVFSLASGGLALSFTIISFLVGENKASIDWKAPLIWCSFLLCIVLDTFSFVYAKYKASKIELHTRKEIELGNQLSSEEVNALIDRQNRHIALFNSIVLALVIITIVCTVLYCFSLMK